MFSPFTTLSQLLMTMRNKAIDNIVGKGKNEVTLGEFI